MEGQQDLESIPITPLYYIVAPGIPIRNLVCLFFPLISGRALAGLPSSHLYLEHIIRRVHAGADQRQSQPASVWTHVTFSQKLNL